MTLQTKTLDGMKYEAAGTKKPSKGNSKRVAIKIANELSTPTLLWLLVKRHKVALLATGNVILLLNWALPQWPQMLQSIFN